MGELYQYPGTRNAFEEFLEMHNKIVWSLHVAYWDFRPLYPGLRLGRSILRLWMLGEFRWLGLPRIDRV